jgi:hypothetical protein
MAIRTSIRTSIRTRSNSHRSSARGHRTGCDRLESRSLVATLTVAPPTVPGNAGEIVDSQYWPYGYSQIGSQWRDVWIGGPLSVRQVTPFNPAGASAGSSAAPPAVPPANTGRIESSQVDVGGFSAIGSQLRGITVAGMLSIDSYDESIGQDAAGGSPPDPTGGGPRPSPQPVPDDPSRVPFSSTTSGIVSLSQFNDGGFGNVGLQWDGGRIGGDLEIRYRSLIGYPDGQGPAQDGGLAGVPIRARPALIQAGTNTGLIEASQFNDGGFGTVGMQWAAVDVAGSVAVGFERFVIQPQVPGETPAPPPPDPHGRPPPGPTTSTATNTGNVVDSQFSDGGFGDIGFQWLGVSVGGRVATSTNGLSIQPERDDVGPITTGGMVFGTSGGSAAATGERHQAEPVPVSGDLLAATPLHDAAAAGGYTENDATNSGRIVSSQFSDGGFGDIGLQWRDVLVEGSVTAVHNALSVQPENRGQGQITVKDVVFPTRPSPSPPSTGGALRPLPPDPSPIAHDGPEVTPVLTPPTAPGDTSFPVNRATNSGDVVSSQFSDGGFGDIGLQWRDVRVAGDVRLVHNALAVQPEGAGLAGVSIENVAFGTPAPSAEATSSPALPTRTLRQLVVRAGRDAGGLGPRRGPPIGTSRLLTNRQVGSGRGDVVLRWNGVTWTAGGLVIVRNALVVQNHGPRSAAVRLANIRFPGRLPRADVSPAGRWFSGAPRQQAVGVSVAAVPHSGAHGRILDAATNSGGLDGNQFSDGGFGDIGLQWRGVSTDGPVTVVRNSLSINVVGDAARTGRIVVSGITFNSGALDGGEVSSAERVLVAPPRHVSRISTVRPVPAQSLPHNRGVIDRSSNSGILRGGQFADGGSGRVALQWQNVSFGGPITIVENVLAVQVAGRQTGPIEVRDVTFA